MLPRRTGTDRDWERLAIIDPHYAVLTEERYRGENIDIAQFFATGEAHIDHVFKQFPGFFVQS